MKRFCMLAVGLLLAGVCSLADAADRAGWKVVEKAIQSAGGEAKLKKHQTAKMSEKGKYYGMGDGLDYTGKVAVAYPDKHRFEVVDVFTVVLNGDKAWMITNGQSTEVTGEELGHQKEEQYGNWVSTLLPLKDEAFGLEVVGDVTAEGRPCTAIKVTHKDHKDVLLDFDKDSGLLTRMRNRAWSNETKKVVDQEVAMFDYADKDGAKLAGRYTVKREGKLFVETEITEYETPDSLPDSLFMP